MRRGVPLSGLAVAILGLLALALPLWTGRVYTQADLGNFHLPLRHFYAGCLGAGAPCPWFPGFFSGFYLHGEGQVGLYHPLHLVLYRLLPLPFAFDLELLANYLLLLAGSFGWLRRLRLETGAALFGALAFSFSGFNLLHVMHLNVVFASAHVPWLLWAIDVALRERGRTAARGALGVGLLTASQLLAGHPQIVWTSAVIEAAYAAFVVVSAGCGPALLQVGGFKLLGVAMAGVQLLPLWDGVTHSVRYAPEREFVASIALHPLELTQLLAPYLFEKRAFGSHPHEMSLYAGSAVPPLLAWLWLRGRSVGAPGRVASAALVFAGLALLLSMGEHGLLYRLQTWLPVVGWFRAPARYLLGFHLGVAVATSIAFADLCRVAVRRSAVTPGGVLAAVPLASAGLAALALAGPLPGPAARLSSPALLAAGPVLSLAATLLVVAAARGVRAAPVALVAFAGLDLLAYGLPPLWRAPIMDVASFVKASAGPASDTGYRAIWGHPALTMRGVRLASGYAALLPARRLDLGGLAGPEPRAIRGEPGVLAALRVAGVGWARGIRLADPLPRARLLTRAVATADVNQEIARIDPARVALVADELALPEGSPGEAIIVEERPGEVRLRTRAPTRQLLVLAESYHEGWRASVDGRRCPVIRVYGDFMGCVVEAGAHEVRFRFDPISLRIGAWLSGLGIAVAGGAYAHLVRRARRMARATPAIG